jgi:choline-sulfatase
MSDRRSRTLLLCVAALSLAACGRGGGELERGKAAGFNLLLVTLDTTRADRIGCYGHAAAATPTLDALAARGVRFADAVSCAPLTTPAHASLLTGLYPPEHGVRNNGERPLAQAFPTLATLLAERGYATAAFVSAFVLDRRYGLDRGFERYDDAIEPTTSPGTFGARHERRAAAVTDAALGWLASRDATRPFFLWVHYYDPHDPYAPPPPFAEAFAGRSYDGEIAYVDSELARVVAALAAAGLEERTLVVVAGDHGESLGEHGEDSHSRTLYEGAMRIPLVLAAPGILPPGEVVSERVVSIVDVLPTLARLLGLQAPAACDGEDLFAGAAPERAVYMETLLTLSNHGWAPLFALRTQRAKFVLAPRREHFDLARDPREERNLYGRSAEATRLERILAERMAAWGGAPLAVDPARARDPAELERLAALGYSTSLTPDGSVGVLDPKDMLPSWQVVVRASRLVDEASQGIDVAPRPDAADKLEEAYRLLSGVLERSPRDRSALLQIARVFILSRRRDLAQQALEQFLSIQPTAEACVLLARLLIEEERFEEAEARLAQASQLEPEHGGIQIARAEAFARRGEWARAEEAYLKALELDPARAHAMATAGLEEARAHLRGGR